MGGCISAPWKVGGVGVVSVPRGLLLLAGVSQHVLRQTPPVNRMTDTFKNITLS